jgi:hypothetical protein
MACADVADEEDEFLREPKRARGEPKDEGSKNDFNIISLMHR